jgi:hypothetical protein
VKLRKERDALINGGLRWVAVEKDYLAYLRESRSEAILVFISRTATKAEIDLSLYGYSVAETLYGQVSKGNKIKINSKKATQGVWLLK